MRIISKLLIKCCILLTATSACAQSYHLQSVGVEKPFSFRLYPGADGQGAFVQYDGKTGLIPLRLNGKAYGKNLKNHAENNISNEWTELVNGQTSGIYHVSTKLGKILQAWYIRHRDQRKFQLAEAEGQPDTLIKLLLHQVLVSCSADASKSQLWMTYPNGTKKVLSVGNIDAPDVYRRYYVADYNFDGYMDVAFSIPDAGMGVYHTFDIYLYHPASKQFSLLQTPPDGKAACSGLCDVSLDPKNKLLLTSCRGGARWWQDSYCYGANNQLIWLRSKQIN